ncbi:MAG: NADPH-dependent FMN reductase, partial [Acinetobacter sp.]|nr:NADPH-dependent FMN reductase [Acinetobacter sp.]
MTKLLGISGSLRRQSYNTALLKAAQKLVGADVELEIVTLHGIPLYDG